MHCKQWHEYSQLHVSLILFVNIISNFGIGDNDFSVHFPLHCTITANTSNVAFDQSDDPLTPWIKYKWNSNFKDDYINNFKAHSRDFNRYSETSEHESVVSLLSNLIKVFYESAEKMKCKNFIHRRSSQPVRWDNECEKSKREKYIALRHFRNTNSHEDLDIYISKRNAFKRIKRDKKYKIVLNNRNQLVESRNNPCEFWKLIKSGCSKPSSSTARL